MSSIPASAIVSVVPSVITAGGTGLDLVGLILTTSAQLPTGTILSFASAADVAAYFGPVSTEAGLAATYFGGYDGSSIKPAKLKFYRYTPAAVAAWLRGGSVASLSLAALQALTGTLTLTTDGTAKTSGKINLSSATSFSNAATIIQAAFSTPNFTVSYDSISGGFVFTSNTTGASSTITVATGTLAAGLKLTAATGAVLSQGAAVATPTATMAAIVALSQDWVSFMTTVKPTDSDKLLFAAWASAQNNRYLYAAWDDNAAATNSGDTSSFGPLCIAAGYSAVVPIYDPSAGANIAAFLLGAIASLDFSAANGRATMAFRTGAVQAGVSNQSVADNLKANGYNFVGAYATANDGFVFFYPGQVTGIFDWIDSWVCQVWMNNAFQLALMTLLTTAGQVAYNQDGFGLIRDALRSVVDDAVNFGAIRAGVTLSAQQIAEVNAAAAGDVAAVLSQQGWYIKVSDPGAQVRALRGSPVIKVFYTDGQ